LNIAEPPIVQIPTESHSFHKIISQAIVVKNSGKEEETASNVAHLTDGDILSFFHKTDNSSSKIQVAKFKAIITTAKLIKTVNQFIVTNHK